MRILTSLSTASMHPDAISSRHLSRVDVAFWARRSSASCTASLATSDRNRNAVSSVSADALCDCATSGVPNIDGVNSEMDMQKLQPQMPVHPSGLPGKQKSSGLRPQGLFAMKKEQGQTFGDLLSGVFEDLAELQHPIRLGRTLPPRPQNRFSSGQSASWVAPISFRR